MSTKLRCALAVVAMVFSAQAAAEAILYERQDLQGPSFTADRRIGNLDRAGFNNRASSALVLNDRWEVCEEARFEGRCVVLRPGRYPSLAAMGLNNSISSARPLSRDARVENARYAPPPVPVYDNRRRKGERLYEANVTSARAVVGPPEQRCWIEKEQVVQERGINVPGAVIGAVVGGILGHQVGRGSGQDIATAGGAVAGGAVGSQVGRGQEVHTRDVQRCQNVTNQKPAFWDVTYHFRGEDHRIQMANPPGPTVTVNGRGEPRA